MPLWRICRKPFAKEPLSGKGGLLASGRWHTYPRSVAYASESLALASLEFLVHLEEDNLPTDLVAIELDLPAALVASLDTSALPRSWRRIPAPRATQKLANSWLDSQTS